MRACSEVGSVLPRGAPAPSVAAAVRGRRPALVVSLDGYDAGHRSDALSLLRGRARIASWFGFRGGGVIFRGAAARAPHFFVTNYQALQAGVASTPGFALAPDGGGDGGFRFCCAKYDNIRVKWV